MKKINNETPIMIETTHTIDENEEALEYNEYNNNDCLNEEISGPTPVTTQLSPVDGTNEPDSVLNCKKKKKRSKRKKKITEVFGVWAIPQDEFDSMCAKWLEDTSNQVSGLTPEQMLTAGPGFKNYNFEGSLRPCHVTKQMVVDDKLGISKPDYSESGDPVSERKMKEHRSSTIPIHTAEDIERIREVGEIGRYVLDVGARFLKKGVTADEIDRVVFKACMSKGVYPSPLNYLGFPKSLCVSVNEVICHGIPDCRPIREGDIVNLDITVFKDGYHADLNETFMIGKCDESAEKLGMYSLFAKYIFVFNILSIVRTAYESLAAAQQVFQPGSLYREIGQHVSSVAHKAGFQVTKAYQGHGIGKCFHQLPNVPHISKNKAVGILRKGHIFTVEPMINEGTWVDTLWPDKWSAVTRDGKRSAQFEHTFLITEDGFEILTFKPGTSKTEMMPFDPEKFRR